LKAERTFGEALLPVGATRMTDAVEKVSAKELWN
jgi:hypothetical protein